MSNKTSQFKLYKNNQNTIQRSTAQRVCVCTCIKPFIQEDIESQQNFSCQNCNQNMQRVSVLKKQNIILEYKNAKFEQQIAQITKQNNHLKHKLSQIIQQKIDQSQLPYSPTFKQDLQAQLFQCKLLNQLIMVGQYNKNATNFQTQHKLQQRIIQKLVLQQQLQQKTRIINDTVLYPIYHYDSRIKTLKQALIYIYKMANVECKKLKQLIRQMTRQMQSIKINFLVQLQHCRNMQYKQRQKQDNNTNKIVNQSPLQKTVVKQSVGSRKQKQPEKRYASKQDANYNQNLAPKLDKNDDKKTNNPNRKSKEKKKNDRKIKVVKNLRPCCNQEL